MARGVSGGVRDEAVLDGGPMDGHHHVVDGGTDQLCVVMSDGQQHRYLRTEELRIGEDGRRRPVFTWDGRYFGPR
jgi:hypothetical protein